MGQSFLHSPFTISALVFCFGFIILILPIRLRFTLKQKGFTLFIRVSLRVLGIGVFSPRFKIEPDKTTVLRDVRLTRGGEKPLKKEKPLGKQKKRILFASLSALIVKRFELKARIGVCSDAALTALICGSLKTLFAFVPSLFFAFFGIKTDRRALNILVLPDFDESIVETHLFGIIGTNPLKLIMSVLLRDVRSKYK